ncbi:hypothetical protein B0H16DRAFT_1475563 [Mycena metata]|uniref:DUF6533 domain-containing protein n=1 Tax=Mycena metata TaxID=1033252 RepID=A0AAD7HE80_9AGAR|nr:hypothetical protein B0H16DRAFT_1475563 [Mycena metata]
MTPILYDHLLTLRSEIRYIWAPGKIGAVAWYFLVRYFALCANLAMFPLAFGNFSTKTYDFIFAEVHPTSEPTEQLLDSQGRFPRSGLPGMLQWDLSPQTASSVYCTLFLPELTLSSEIAGLWEAMFAGDVVFLGLTVYRGYTQSRLLAAAPPPGTLLHVVVRDARYFSNHPTPASIICIANLINIVIYYSSNINAGLSSFTAALSVTAAGRLITAFHPYVDEAACTLLYVGVHVSTGVDEGVDAPCVYLGKPISIFTLGAEYPMLIGRTRIDQRRPNRSVQLAEDQPKTTEDDSSGNQTNGSRHVANYVYVCLHTRSRTYTNIRRLRLHGGGTQCMLNLRSVAAEEASDSTSTAVSGPIHFISGTAPGEATTDSAP